MTRPEHAVFRPSRCVGARGAVILAALTAAVVALIVAAPLHAEPAGGGAGRILFGWGESGEGGVAVIDGDGKHRRDLPLNDASDPLAAVVFGMSWSPDGRSIAFDRLEPRSDTRRSDIWTANADGHAAVRRVVRNGDSPDWSPNARTIAFVRGADIWLVDLNDRRQRRIVRHGRSPRWSPDGKRLIFERGRSRSDIWVLELNARKERRLVRDADAADWSPDGRQIAFDRCRVRSSGNVCFIYVMRADGTALRRLFEGEQPLWSPSGHEIAFIDSDERRQMYDAIFRARVDGSGRRIVYGRHLYCGCTLLDWGPAPH